MFNFKKQDEFEEFCAKRDTERNLAADTKKFLILVTIALLAIGWGVNAYDLYKLRVEVKTLETVAERYDEQEDLIELMVDTIAAQQKQINALVVAYTDGGVYAEPNDSAGTGNHVPIPKAGSDDVGIYDSSVSDDPPAEAWDGPSDKF